MYGLTLQTPPAVEPVTLAQVKSFCTVASGFTDDDALLTGLIVAGRQQAESYTRRAVFNQTWKLTLDHFPLFWERQTVKSISNQVYPFDFFFQGMAIKIPKPLLQSITSFTYLDPTNTQQTLSGSDYYIDSNSEPARLIPVSNAYWPASSVYIPGSIAITYVAGSYGDGTEVNTCPGNVSTAISLYAAHFYAHREGNVPLPDAFYRLLDPVKFTAFGFGDY